MAVRVTPNVACLWRYWFQLGPELPRSLAFSCSACDGGLGLPLVLHLRLYRRWIIESPRCSHHSAVPTYQSSSCPKSQPFGIAYDSLSELPRTLNPPAPIDGYPSYLGSRTIRFALVQSPLIPSLARHRHARYEHCNQEAGRFALRLPSGWFCQLPDQSFRARRSVAFLNGTRCS